MEPLLCILCTAINECMNNDPKKGTPDIPPVKDPAIHPDAVPDMPVQPAEDPEIIPDEDPFENPPPYEIPEPGEGP